MYLTRISEASIFAMYPWPTVVRQKAAYTSLGIVCRSFTYWASPETDRNQLSAVCLCVCVCVCARTRTRPTISTSLKHISSVLNIAQKTATSSMALQEKVQPVFGTTNFSLRHIHDIRLSVPATNSFRFPPGASVHLKSFSVPRNRCRSGRFEPSFRSASCLKKESMSDSQDKGNVGFLLLSYFPQLMSYIIHIQKKHILL